MLTDIKHITKQKLCPGMAQAAANEQEEDEELIVTNFNDDGEQLEEK